MTDIVEQLQKESDKNFGPVMINGNDLIEEKRKIISFSPAIDIGLGGGIPEGSWVLLSGKEKCGKTTSALQIAANAQQMGKTIYVYTPENRLKPRDLKGIYNLDPSQNFKIIRSSRGNILSAEKFLDHLIKTAKTHPGCIIIVDSASALCSTQEFASEISSQFRNPGAKLMASLCRQLGNYVPPQKTIIILTQHLIANTGKYGASSYEDGGRKIQYQADVKLRCKAVTPWKEKEKQVGQIINWIIKSSAIGEPEVQVNSYLRYGHGLDREAELFHLGCDFGLITGKGWYTFDCFESQNKFRGESNCIDFLRSDPRKCDELYEQIKAMV